MNFFTEKDLQFDDNYKEFFASLNEQEHMDFLYEYKKLFKQFNDLIHTYNERVSERITTEAKKKFLKGLKQSVVDKNFDYKQFYKDAMSYGLISRDVWNELWEVRDQLP